MIRVMLAAAMAVTMSFGLLADGSRALAGDKPLLEKKDKLTDDDKGYEPGKGIEKLKVINAEEVSKEIKGSKHKVYTLKLKQNEKVVIEMHSKPMDSVVVVEDTKHNVLALNDDASDDAVGTLDSRLQFTAPADGEYRIIATCLPRTPGFQKTGDFTLKVTKAK